MVVGYKDDHSDHDFPLTKLLQTVQQNNVKSLENLMCIADDIMVVG